MFLIPADIVYSNLIKPSREIAALKIKSIRRKNALLKLGARNLGWTSGGVAGGGAGLSGFGSSSVKVSGSGWIG